MGLEDGGPGVWGGGRIDRNGEDGKNIYRIYLSYFPPFTPLTPLKISVLPKPTSCPIPSNYPPPRVRFFFLVLILAQTTEFTMGFHFGFCGRGGSRGCVLGCSFPEKGGFLGGEFVGRVSGERKRGENLRKETDRGWWDTIGGWRRPILGGGVWGLAVDGAVAWFWISRRKGQIFGELGLI